MLNTPFDTTRTIDIICMGRVAVDFYAEQVGSPLPSAQSFRLYLGGCAGNIAVGTTRQGLVSAMFSCVGKDDMGQFLIQTLTKEGVDLTLLRETPDHLTGLVILGVNPPDNFPLIFYRENCADMQIQTEDCKPDILKKAKALLVTGTGFSTDSMRLASHHALQVAKQNGTAIVLDLDYRPVLWGLTAKGEGETRFKSAESVTEHYQKILPHCDLLVGTEEEVLIAGGGKDLQKALHNVRQFTNAPIVLKTGAKGCHIYLEDLTQPITVQSFPIKVLNVLGAGDAFMSGFLRGWLRGESWETCAEYANANGALVVTRHGCASAMPTYDETQYFIQHYHKQSNVSQSPALSRLHRKVSVGDPAEESLWILAFDHRWQFEKSCDAADKKHTLITQFKNQVFAGFQAVQQEEKNNSLALLVDPQYGEEILKAATEKEITVGAPIEATGTMPVQWISSRPLYQEILERPASWFVKVLWQYHPLLEDSVKRRQFEQLKQLASVCNALDRKLMLELIVPKDLPKGSKAVQEIMQAVYAEDIYPYWWKIAAMENKAEWEQLAETLHRNDPSARIIVLGGECKDIASYQQSFALAKQTGLVAGFAVGRSIFWKAWEDLINDKINLEDVPEIISHNYRGIIAAWRQ